jgi:uncharacterized protein YjbJ (UPF0337 family)
MEGYSPKVLQKAVRQGSKSASFAEASEDLQELAQVQISARHVETLVERVGQEWAEKRDADVAAFREDELKRDYPQAPKVSAVMLDGGRAQTRADEKPPGVHEPGWKETKVGCCLTLDSPTASQDPQPEPPKQFLDPSRVVELVRQVKARGGKITGDKESESKNKPQKAKAKRSKRRRKKRVKPLVRTVIATMADSEKFGWQVAAEVHRRGLDQAGRKACVCDGGRSNWSIFEMHLAGSGFIPILDFLHLLVYLYAAAHAAMGKGVAQTFKSWQLYERWLRMAWSGKAKELLTELIEAAERLGPPPNDAGDQDPRKILAEAVTYVTNNQERMDYPRYRMLGLPISSAPVESVIKQLNRRVKGSEKFWLKNGLETILQVRSAYLSQDGRADRNWERPRPYRRAAGHGPLPKKKVA